MAEVVVDSALVVVVGFAVVVVVVVVGLAVVVAVEEVVVCSVVVVVVSSVVVVVLSVVEETDRSCGTDSSGTCGVCPQAVSKTIQRSTQRIRTPICFINIPLYKLSFHIHGKQYRLAAYWEFFCTDIKYLCDFIIHKTTVQFQLTI